MAKSFNEMCNLLKDLIKDMNSDAHNSRSFKEERYNNLKMTMDPTTDANPHVVITIGVSEAKYSINSLQRINGSLGPDEKYINRWFNRVGVIDSLKDLWKATANKDKETVEAGDIEDMEELKSKEKEKKKKKH